MLVMECCGGQSIPRKHKSWCLFQKAYPSEPTVPTPPSQVSHCPGCRCGETQAADTEDRRSLAERINTGSESIRIGKPAKRSKGTACEHGIMWDGMPFHHYATFHQEEVL